MKGTNQNRHFPSSGWFERYHLPRFMPHPLKSQSKSVRCKILFEGGYKMLVVYLCQQKLKTQHFVSSCMTIQHFSMIEPCAWSYLLKFSMLRSIHTHKSHENLQRMSFDFQYLGKLKNNFTNFKLYEDHFFPFPFAGCHSRDIPNLRFQTAYTAALVVKDNYLDTKTIQKTPKTNMEPEKDGSQKGISFSRCPFSGSILVFGGVITI